MVAKEAANENRLWWRFLRTGARIGGRRALLRLERCGAARLFIRAGSTKRSPVSGDEVFRNMTGRFQGILRGVASKLTGSVVNSVWPVLVSYETVNRGGLVGAFRCRSWERYDLVSIWTVRINVGSGGRPWYGRITYRLAKRPCDTIDTNTILNTVLVNDDSIVRR